MTGWTCTATIERFPLSSPFTIARGAKTEAVVVVATVHAEGFTGRGEALPYARYGETPEGVVEVIRGARSRDRTALLRELPPGAARNALDLAWLDLEARRDGTTVSAILGLKAPAPVPILYTLPIREPDETERLAVREAARPVLKLKVGRPDDLARVEAARRGAPDARLMVDANEGWDLATLNRLAAPLADLGVELIEQPLPQARDLELNGYRGPLPLCADESLHGGVRALDALHPAFSMVNVKLDKAGGLTTAVEVLRRARARGLEVMVGSMVATSLAVAPAVLLAQEAQHADLDAPLFLARDREPSLRFEGSVVYPPAASLYGG